MHMVLFMNNLCRVCAPQRGEKVSGLAARQRAKLGKILNQVHSDIIAERENGKLLHTKCTCTCSYNITIMHDTDQKVSTCYFLK